MEQDPSHNNAKAMNADLKSYNDRLETLRERIEGAARLHHLLSLKLKEDDVQNEMMKLAEKIGLPNLIQNYKNNLSNEEKSKVTHNIDMNLKSASKTKTTITTTLISTSTPNKYNECEKKDSCHCWKAPQVSLSSVEEDVLSDKPHEIVEKPPLPTIDNEDDNSKLSDSGVGACERCSETDGTDVSQILRRTCSCQSFEDTATNACDETSHISDELDDECLDASLADDKNLDLQNSGSKLVPVPMQANAHLYCHASNLQLDLDDRIIDQKTQK